MAQQISDYLNAFSVDDLRELANRRSIAIPENAQNARQSLVRILSPVLGRYDASYGVVQQLSRGELACLEYLLNQPKARGVESLVQASGAPESMVRHSLDSLRLWGLVFPEGNWKQVAIPSTSRYLQGFVRGWAPTDAARLRQNLTPPDLEPVLNPKTHPRPGASDRDVAELLARIDRGRLRLTQAGRLNRRDLKAMEASFGIVDSEYALLFSGLLAHLGLASTAEGGLLSVAADVDAWLLLPQPNRAATLAVAWQSLPGFPETAHDDPATASYYPTQLFRHRILLTGLLAMSLGDIAVTVSSVARVVEWTTPQCFAGWSMERDVARVVARLARSAYWLGLADVDDPQSPRVIRPAAGLSRMMGDTAAPPAIPEESQFILQPNAEIFAPPNLAARTYFHMRRLTGEKKAGAAGMHPLTPDSVRRALDNGITPGHIATFLERFSRSGLPANVRTLVETTGRQHGRIRLIPAGYVLVTDDGTLLRELRSIRTVQPFLGDEITDRAVTVEAVRVPELLRGLRSRGYAPTDLADRHPGPALPERPESAGGIGSAETASASHPIGHAPATTPASSAAGPEPTPSILDDPQSLDWPPDEDDWEAPEVGAKVEDTLEIVDLLDYAVDESEILEAAFQRSQPRNEPEIPRFWPFSVAQRSAQVMFLPSRQVRRIKIQDLAWVRRTGERHKR